VDGRPSPTTTTGPSMGQYQRPPVSDLRTFM
jgi:hypothetical protein